MNKCVLQKWPETAAEWNKLSLEEQIRIIFYDEWLENIDPSQLWYHYTTIDALQTMLTNDGVELWASHSKFVNDKDEIRKGAEHVAHILSAIADKYKVLKRYENAEYMACLSLEKDSIPMWNTYGGNGFGIALGFKPHIHPKDKYQCMKVIYEESEEEKNWWDKMLQQAKLKNNIAKVSEILNIIYLPMAYKSHGFTYEKEIRLLCLNDDDVFFRTRKGLLVPYKKILIGYENLSEIMIGPSADAERMQCAIEILLKQKGIEGVNVVRSKAPLRN